MRKRKKILFILIPSLSVVTMSTIGVGIYLANKNKIFNKENGVKNVEDFLNQTVQLYKTKVKNQNYDNPNWKWKHDLKNQSKQEAQEYIENLYQEFNSSFKDIKLLYEFLDQSENNNQFNYGIKLKLTYNNKEYSKIVSNLHNTTITNNEVLTLENYKNFINDRLWLHKNIQNSNIVPLNKEEITVLKREKIHNLKKLLGIEEIYLEINEVKNNKKINSLGIAKKINQDKLKEKIKLLNQEWSKNNLKLNNLTSETNPNDFNDWKKLKDNLNNGNKLISDDLLQFSGLTNKEELLTIFNYEIEKEKVNDLSAKFYLKIIQKFESNFLNPINNIDPFIIEEPYLITKNNKPNIENIDVEIEDFLNQTVQFYKTKVKNQNYDNPNWKWKHDLKNQSKQEAQEYIENVYQELNSSFRNVKLLYEFLDQSENNNQFNYGIKLKLTYNNKEYSKIVSNLHNTTITNNEFLTLENYKNFIDKQQWVFQNYQNPNIYPTDKSSFDLILEKEDVDIFTKSIGVKKAWLSFVDKNNNSNNYKSMRIFLTGVDAAKWTKLQQLWNETNKLSKTNPIAMTTELDTILTGDDISLNYESGTIASDELMSFTGFDDPIFDNDPTFLFSYFTASIIREENTNKFFMRIQPNYSTTQAIPSDVPIIELREPLYLTYNPREIGNGTNDGSPSETPVDPNEPQPGDPNEDQINQKLNTLIEQENINFIYEKPAFIGTLVRKFDKLISTPIFDQDAELQEWIQKGGVLERKFIKNSINNKQIGGNFQVVFRFRGKEYLSKTKNNATITINNEVLNHTLFKERMKSGEFIWNNLKIKEEYTKKRSIQDFSSDMNAGTDQDSLDAAFVGSGNNGGEVKLIQISDSDVFDRYFDSGAILPSASEDNLKVLMSYPLTNAINEFGVLDYRLGIQSTSGGALTKNTSEIHQISGFRSKIIKDWNWIFEESAKTQWPRWTTASLSEFPDLSWEEAKKIVSRWTKFIEFVELRENNPGGKITQIHPLGFEPNLNRYKIYFKGLKAENAEFYRGKIALAPLTRSVQNNLYDFYKDKIFIEIEKEFRLQKVDKLIRRT